MSDGQKKPVLRYIFCSGMNTFLEQHRWGTASGPFGNVYHYFSAILPFLQKQSPKETLEAVSQMRSSNIVETLWGEHIWGTASATLEIVLHYFLSVQFYLCPQFWQIYFKCFLHTALLQSLQLILTLASLFLFSLYFSCPRISSMQMW